MLGFGMIILAAGLAFGQKPTTFTGTAVIYGSGFNTRTITRTFTLDIRGKTSKADAERYLTTLQNGGQDALLAAISKNDLGRFSLDGSLGRPLTAVVVDQVDGKTRIRAVFERWIGFGEIRYGYRSVDYPFGYVEVLIDPATGKGSGTFIPAAQIRFKKAKDGGNDTVTVEDFGVFPGQLLGVQMNGPVL